MSLSLRIDVTTPCTGEQIVNKQDPRLYAGSSGDFTYAVLSSASTAVPWRIVVYDYSRATACTPVTEFIQDPFNPNDPTGDYSGVDSNGDPDSSLGTATVSTFP